jgi:hypothetical protein
MRAILRDSGATRACSCVSRSAICHFGGKAPSRETTAPILKRLSPLDGPGTLATAVV